MAYVVTNKWLKAGYAEGLRRLFAESAWVEFMADFGHARRFFPDADVFPCIISVRKPNDSPAPDTFELAVIPRDDVPRSGLAEAVRAASYVAKRDILTSAPWMLETPEVAALLAKIKGNNVALMDYAGVHPLYGIKTGFNEAFLIDTAIKDRLISEDPRASEIIKPYLRGQDIDRWLPSWADLWMIFARKGLNIDSYPSVLRHLEGFRTQLEPKPDSWQPTQDDQKWPGRKAGSYKWYELQDPVEYHAQFELPKIVLRRIAFYSQVAIDRNAFYVNDSALILPSTDPWIVACLNSPAIWYLMFKQFPHKKDEALAFDIPYVEHLPIPPIDVTDAQRVAELVDSLTQNTRSISDADKAVADWLRHEIGVQKLPSILLEGSNLDSDGFVTAVRSALPKRETLSPARLSQLRNAFTETLAPARAKRIAARADERTLSDLVHRAYSLTPEDLSLMWRTAPPRMPLGPA